MSDLVKRLRSGMKYDDDGMLCVMRRLDCHVAARKIEELTAERDKLKEALEKLSCRFGQIKPLWWQEIARNALKTEEDE